MKQFNFTIQEILSDGSNVDVDNKKSIAKKYGIDSNKCKEIAKQIYAIGLEIIKTHDHYDADDMLVWNRYWEFPESSQKLRLALADMDDEFVQMLIDHTQKYLDSHSFRRYPWVEKKVNAMRKILDERHESKDDKSLETMISRINDQTAEFHKTYVQNLVDWAVKTFNSMLRFKNVRTLADVDPDRYVDLMSRREVLVSVRKFRAQSNDFDRNYYLNKTVEDAENNFKSAVALIAKRCEKAGLVADRLQVNEISDNDAKAFEIYVSDGEKTMHARSIFCAEFSSIVTPHWRFIITNA